MAVATALETSPCPKSRRSIGNVSATMDAPAMPIRTFRATVTTARASLVFPTFFPVAPADATKAKVARSLLVLTANHGRRSVSKLLLFKKGRAIRAVRVIYRRLATAEWTKCEPPPR